MKKQIGEMTVSELKKYIRKLTRKANTRLRNISKRKKVSKAVSDEMDYLRNKGIIGKSGKAIYGFRGKRKADLQTQARELEYFNQWKGSVTKETIRKEDYKKYKTFIEDNPEFANYTFDQWEELVSVFGKIQNTVEGFVYENTKQLHLESTKKQNKVDFVKAVDKVDIQRRIMQKMDKNKVFTNEEITDMLRKEVFRNV